MIEPARFSRRWLQFVTREQCRAEHAGVHAVAGEADRSVRAEAWPNVSKRDAASGLEQELAGACSVTPDHDLLWVESVDRVCNPDADPLAPDLDHARRGLVAVSGGADHVGAQHRLAFRAETAERRLGAHVAGLRREPIEGVAGGHELERASLRK